MEDQPAYNNLIGRAEHISQMGTLFTDFTLIKPGILHRANGGYLMLDARKVLLQPYAWEGLKHALRAQEIRLESLAQSISLISTVSLEPEPIPLDVKVVLMADRDLYYLLHQYDPDFADLFKVAADFEDEMVRDSTPAINLRATHRHAGAQKALRHFDKEAVALVIEHGARLAGDAANCLPRHKVCRFAARSAIGREKPNAQSLLAPMCSAAWKPAYRNGRIRERLQEAILEDTILIDTQGAVVGQITGLAVYMLGAHQLWPP
ncbi:MAG: AAA family ATPase [bacterium]|nr:AAA family ATPase [bacterium]